MNLKLTLIFTSDACLASYGTWTQELNYHGFYHAWYSQTILARVRRGRGSNILTVDKMKGVKLHEMRGIPNDMPSFIRRFIDLMISRKFEIDTSTMKKTSMNADNAFWSVELVDATGNKGIHSVTFRVETMQPLATEIQYEINMIFNFILHDSRDKITIKLQHEIHVPGNPAAVFLNLFRRLVSRVVIKQMKEVFRNIIENAKHGKTPSKDISWGREAKRKEVQFKPSGNYCPYCGYELPARVKGGECPNCKVYIG